MIRFICLTKLNESRFSSGPDPLFLQRSREKKYHETHYYMSQLSTDSIKPQNTLTYDRQIENLRELVREREETKLNITIVAYI